MKKRPLIFIILASIHLLEPIIKILYFKMTVPFDIGTIVSNIWAISSPKEVFEFWFLFPLGGLALLGVKKWSYPIFVGVQIYNIYAHLTYEKFTWPYVSEIPLMSSMILLFVNTLIIIYFSLPEVRKPFFDRTMRWWETRTRYNKVIPITVKINNPNHIYDCHILNISTTGVFIDLREDVEVGTELELSINYKDQAVTLHGKKVSDHAFNNIRGIGVQFEFMNIYEKWAMRKIVRMIAKENKQLEKLSSNSSLAA
ncbi:MAG: PilZ domain-containing protein [Oligoflexia bacterium]|nr:PilZ domain-containing protein [Oligoflexia bacterium]